MEPSETTSMGIDVLLVRIKFNGWWMLTGGHVALYKGATHNIQTMYVWEESIKACKKDLKSSAVTAEQ